MYNNLTRQQFDSLNNQIRQALRQEDQLSKQSANIAADAEKLAKQLNENKVILYNKRQANSEIENKLNLLKKDQELLLQKIHKEKTTIETINLFLSEYNEYEDKPPEVIGSLAEELNQLNDEINSINVNI